MTDTSLTVYLADGERTACLLARFDPRTGALVCEGNAAADTRFNPLQEEPTAALLLDSLPDLWGRKVAGALERARARRSEVRARELDNSLLLESICDSDRMGALRFSQSGPASFLGPRRYAAPTQKDLSELCQTARFIETGENLSALTLERFAENAVALGGSRPKAGFVDEHGRLWMAKFPSDNDDRDKGAWEYCLTRLAREAGIRTAPCRLHDVGDNRGRVFASCRFDRTSDGSRLPYLSARALLGASTNRECRCYRDLVSIIERICSDVQREKEELWRRTVFKCLICDGDDHLRNLGFLCTGNGWMLAPVFDLNASLSKTHLTMSYADGCRDLSVQAVLAAASDWGLESARAREILDEVRATLIGWQKAAEELDIAADEIERMRPAFALPC